MRPLVMVGIVLVAAACGPSPDALKAVIGAADGGTTPIGFLECPDPSRWTEGPPAWVAEHIDDVTHDDPEAAVHETLREHALDTDEVQIAGVLGVIVRDGRNVISTEAALLSNGGYARGAVTGCMDAPSGAAR